jgi:hypothetical protein
MLFYYLISDLLDIQGDFEAEFFGGLEVDDQFKLSRLQDRQIGWSFAL